MLHTQEPIIVVWPPAVPPAQTTHTRIGGESILGQPASGRYNLDESALLGPSGVLDVNLLVASHLL